jgi:hypothetical protein
MKMEDHKYADRQFDQADRDIDETAATVMLVIESLLGRTAALEWVAQSYVVEQLFLRLLRKHDLVKLLDEVALPGPVTFKLSSAMRDYRDAQFEMR